jgi:hypothetical protein
MDFWDILTYGAWGLSALLLLWMVADAIKVNREYDENLLMSSREGVDDLFDDGTVRQDGRS